MLLLPLVSEVVSSVVVAVAVVVVVEGSPIPSALVVVVVVIADSALDSSEENIDWRTLDAEIAAEDCSGESNVEVAVEVSVAYIGGFAENPKAIFQTLAAFWPARPE